MGIHLNKTFNANVIKKLVFYYNKYDINDASC